VSHLVARAVVVGIVVVLVLGSTGPAAAQSTGVQAPTVTRTKLDNGLTVLVRENPSAPVVAMSLMLRLGTRTETRDVAGISNLLQLMAVRGTTGKSGTEIVEAAERMGGSIDAFADVDTSEIAVTALSRHGKEILELAAEVALTPTIGDSTIQAVKDFLIKQIRNRGDKPYEAGVDVLMARLFGDHPYAWNPLGTRDSVERLDRAALLGYYRRHYVPGDMVLAVSGRVQTAQVIAEARRLFGALPPGQSARPSLPAPPALEASRAVIEVPGAQAQILLGGFAPTLTDPDHAAAKVLAAVLGGGMAGRFFSEIRDKQGLAYTTGVSYPSRIERGFIQAQIGTGPENVERAEAALRRELDRIQREPIPEEELRVAKAYLLGNLAMDRRTNARQAWYLAAYELAGVGYEHLDRYVTQVRAVTAADVQRAAQRYLGTLRTIIVKPPAR
jgi:zinc protease